jgi:hypothetical protein
MAVEPVKTKMPEEAAGRPASGLACWIQKPRLLPVDRTAVTIPATRSTTLPRSGERNPLPWMSWIVAGPGWQAGSFGVTAQSTNGGVTGVGGAFGVGAATLKSVALLPVLDAIALRWADVEFDGADAAPEPAKSLLDPKPTKSTTLAPFEQELPQPAIAAVLFYTSATFPFVALRLMDPVTSADGSGEPMLPPLASWTMK